MFPLRDVIPSRTTPWVTYSLIAINVLAWMLGANHWPVVAGNVLVLWVFGENVEDRCGHGRFLMLYLVCGGITALSQAASGHDWLATSLAASAANGAAAGLIAAYFTLFPKSLVLIGVFLIVYADVIEVPAVVIAGAWAVMQLLGTPVVFWAYLAAAFVGALGVWLLKRPERQRVEWWS